MNGSAIQKHQVSNRVLSWHDCENRCPSCMALFCLQCVGMTKPSRSVWEGHASFAGDEAVTAASAMAFEVRLTMSSKVFGKDRVINRRVDGRPNRARL